MLPKQLLLLCFAVATARAQNNDDAPGSLSFSQTLSVLSDFQPSSFAGSQYTYVTLDGQSTITTTRSSAGTSSGTGSTATGSGTDSDAQSTRTSTSQSLTVIGGSTPTTNGSASSTSSSAQPTNTLPCNGYPEFCNRRYSNVTHVAAHNSAFSIRNNAASNQYFDTETQLNDGIRMIQGQTHYVNDTIYNCHTSCDLLNAGTWQSQLEVITNWVTRHPYDVVTILIGNSDLVPVGRYVPAIQNSGLARYLYEPDVIPLRRDDWPTLSEMILSGKRVVLFMDYMANQQEVPYILNEFTHMWETPFSPTDQAFPCTVQRPPDLNKTKAQEQFMYMANHNLNTAVSLSALTGGGGGEPILIPNTAEINQTNGQFDKFGQLERARLDCTEQWNHPPNFLLVDYYNYGDPQPGSVFEVAARANGVEYTRSCCGAETSAAPVTKRQGSTFALTLASVALVLAVVI